MADTARSENLHVSIANFGPIARADIDLRPLTVFVGPSNTGKSYLAVLLYALHKFFSRYPGGLFQRQLMWSPPGPRITRHSLRRVSRDADIPEAAIRDLIAWAELIRAQDESGTEDRSPILVPESVASLVRQLLAGTSDFVDVLVSEVERCFGIEDARRLIRHKSRRGATVGITQRASGSSSSTRPFKYELTVKKTGARLEASIPPETPLQFPIAEARSNRVTSMLAAELSQMARFLDREPQSERRGVALSLVDDLSDLVFPYTVGPLSRVAHYLPADRTGVMHAHRVVVGSLIARASRGGLQRDEPLPALSGVFTDFLEQLIELGDVPTRNRDTKSGVVTGLEDEMLYGSIVTDFSDIGYPEFSYRPDGWSVKDSLPLMNASSMVSELAPVILYLRHVVRPGDVLIIEEPESHLHPEMQVEFTRQLAAAVQSGIRVMITTHSEWVLEELANIVRMSELSMSQRAGIRGAAFALAPTDVGAWLFEPKLRPKGSIVKELPLDVDSGTFSAGYSDVNEEVYNRWVEVDSRIQEYQPR